MSETKEQEDQPYEDLEELRQKVKLSANKLLELTYNDNKYVEKLIFLNKEAKKLINEDLIQQALIYLEQAQRVLEYGASCGKTIDRNMIICTLHNEACCYYKEADLITSAKYLEGLIYNLKAHLNSIQSSPANSGVVDSNQLKRTNGFVDATIEKKIELTHYYLKFCTINSQAKNRNIALEAGKKVIQILKALIDELVNDSPKINGSDQLNSEQEISDLKVIIKSIRLMRDDIETSDLPTYIKLGRYFTKKWNENKIIRKINFNLEKHINNYSISQVIEMTPLQYISDQDFNFNKCIDSKTIMRQLLHFSMGYFTISTQYRLIAEQLYKNSQEKNQSEEYIKANIYHLMSILFLACNINCDLLFMKQIIASYEHHFKIDLFKQQFINENIEDLAQKLLFEDRKQKSKVKMSLIQKINKLKSKEKQRQRQKQKRIKSEYEDLSEYESKTSYKLNSSKAKQKVKRSISKNKILSSNKKIIPLLNDTLLESTKNLNASKQRSVSLNKTKHKRSISKGVQDLKHKANQIQKLQEKHTKRTNDQYQLNMAKNILNGRKRINSQSSAEASNRSKDFSRSKNRIDVNQTENKLKKKIDTKNQPSKKKKKTKKQISAQHYYM